MNFRISSLVTLFVALPFLTYAENASKKGHGGDAEKAGKLKASWYYNWGPKGTSSDGLEFVPMVKKKEHATTEVLDAIKASGAKVLLGFNEPERTNQGNLTVEEALDLWPKLMATGLRLGSPAPSSDGKGMAWLEQFMEGVEKRKLRVDFIAIHWYRSSKVSQFEDFLKDLNRRYKRPVWVTEFNSQFSSGDHDKFAAQGFDMCDKLKFVERYSYFSTKPGTPGSLWKEGGSNELSPLGEEYAKH